MSLQNESLNFELFTKLPSPPSSLLTPFVAVSPLVRPLAAHAPRPGQNRLVRPGIAPNRSLLASRAAATRPASSLRDTQPNTVAALDVRVHASPCHCSRRCSSCPHRFTTPNPSSPLPLLALEPELELPALEAPPASMSAAAMVAAALL